MTTIEEQRVRMWVDLAADCERRMKDIRAGRWSFAPGQAHELYHKLRGMIQENAEHLERIDIYSSDCWVEMEAVQQRLAEHLDDLREFL